MNAFLIFYWTAIVSLLLYAFPAWTAKGARKGLIAAAALGVLLTGYEVFMTFVWGPTVSGPIRVDIFIVILIALLGHIVGGASLVLARKRAGLAGGYLALLILPLVALAGVGYEVWSLQNESARLTANFFEANRLLFEARFRDPETLRRTFGKLEAESNPLAGHWRREEGSPPSRMVINAKGEVWAFYSCGDTECLGGEGTVRNGRIATTHHILPAYLFEVTTVTPERMTLMQVSPARTPRGAPPDMTFVREPPPLKYEAPQAGALKYLGTYSALTDRGRAHLTLTQVWLWQEGETMYAVVVHTTQVKGQQAMFIRPVLFSAGARDIRRTHSYVFDSEDGEGTVRIELLENGDRVRATLERLRGEIEIVTLDKKEYLTDEALSLAPVDSGEAWKHWFDAVMTGRFFQWTAPGSADAPAGG
ncbi:hypothetical protein [Nitrospina gracilis]|uniref:hypothetical protein n=1 Tax=Nitrospina gracilis TaxID=35801 RepID=UPI001F25CAF8|nr:hypothetical protein [Nitrospina gracilis]MCF8721797.1 hypothetical protein [Nitrospina gracilis Nb-211]